MSENGRRDADLESPTLREEWEKLSEKLGEIDEVLSRCVFRLSPLATEYSPAKERAQAQGVRLVGEGTLVPLVVDSTSEETLSLREASVPGAYVKTVDALRREVAQMKGKAWDVIMTHMNRLNSPETQLKLLSRVQNRYEQAALSEEAKDETAVKPFTWLVAQTSELVRLKEEEIELSSNERGEYNIHEERAIAVAELAKEIENGEIKRVRRLERKVDQLVPGIASSEGRLRKSLRKVELEDGGKLYVGARQGGGKKERQNALLATVRRCREWCEEQGIALPYFTED